MAKFNNTMCLFILLYDHFVAPAYLVLHLIIMIYIYWQHYMLWINKRIYRTIIAVNFESSRYYIGIKTYIRKVKRFGHIHDVWFLILSFVAKYSRRQFP